MAGLGEELRAAREARNLSLSDVSERLHIRTVYLQSLEEEDWAAIAAPVYVRGFLRTYARFLGLDPEAVVARFNEAVPVQQGSTAQVRLVGAARRGPSPWLWLAAAVAVVLLVYVGYNYYELQQEQAATTVRPAAEPQTARTAPLPGAGASRRLAAVPPAAHSTSATGEAGRKVLALKLVQRSWLRIAVDGQVPMEGIYPAGTERVFHGKSVTVRAGNAAGVDVAVNGRDLGTLGAPGDVVERTFTLAQE
jgi:cytoskeleton protein RodZ